MDASNTWRRSLAQDSRQKIVKRIMDTLQRHTPPIGQEGTGELLRIAWRLEEKIFDAATDQQDYLRKISIKMLALETKAQPTPATAIQERIGNPAGVVGNTWRTSLAQESRQKIVERIMDTLQRHMPPTGQESMGELLKIAWRLEEKIFDAATDQQDYLRKISIKMLALETKVQPTQATAIQERIGNPAGVVGNTWRTSLAQESRQKIVERIMDTLQRHMPPTGQESMGELLKIAWRLEEKIFDAATDQQDYLRKISIKMLALATKGQAGATAAAGSLSNPAAESEMPMPGASPPTASTLHSNLSSIPQNIGSSLQQRGMSSLYQTGVTATQPHAPSA